jgi:hypothetical protein
MLDPRGRGGYDVVPATDAPVLVFPLMNETSDLREQCLNAHIRVAEE